MKELRQRFWLRLTTFLTLTACFALLATGVVAAKNLSRVLAYWGEEIQVTAYLSSSLTPSEVESLREKLRADSRVAKVELVTQKEALEDFRAQMASYAPDLAGDPDLFSLIPASLQISLKEEDSGPARVAEVAHLAKSQTGIDEVRYGQEWIEKYGAVLSVIRRGVWIFGIVIGLAALLVIGNSVRASVEARRSEVEVLELVGATPWMIRKPFLMEGASLGFFAATGAVLAVGGGFLALKSHFQSELHFLQLSAQIQFLPTLSLFLFLALGTMLGALASYLCVRRVNDGFAAAGGRR